MIVRKHLRPHKVIRYIWKELALATASACIVLWLYEAYHFKWLSLNFAPFAILGTALSIFLAFRTNSAYARWGQAAQAWMAMRSGSRVFARLIKTLADGHSNLPAYNKKRSDAYITEMANRQIAWLHSARLSLRRIDNYEELRPYLTSREFAQLKKIQNKPAFLLARQGERIYEGLNEGILQGFDSFQTETQLSQLANAYAITEQIKEITIPRPYGYFTHLFVEIFIVIAPLFLLGIFVAADAGWLVIPMSVLIALLFAPIDGLGSIIERPFENDINDVPLTSIVCDAERDILEVIGEKELPETIKPADGYLY